MNSLVFLHGTTAQLHMLFCLDGPQRQTACEQINKFELFIHVFGQRWYL